MSPFPRTQLGGLSVSRMVVGSNWFLGYAHQTQSKTEWIKSYQTRKQIASVLEVFLREDIDVVMGTSPLLSEAIADAQQAVGRKMHLIATPNWEIHDGDPNLDDARAKFDIALALGATFCWPHSCATDRLYDGPSHSIRCMDLLCSEIRQRGMIPGLSTHRPEVIVAADRTDLDVASYICIYNSAGFLMPYEIDWTQRVIRHARKPVTTIKPMAAGRVMPYVGLPFVWSTLRDCDLVTVGTLTPDEARECIEISRAVLERRDPNLQLQYTRSKQLLADQP